MTYPKVQFVASPDLTADVRFDFNTAGEWADEQRWPGREAFSLGAPSLQGDPDGIGAEYGLRQLSFNLMVDATATAAAKVMSQLSRELQRPHNWLLFQFSEFSDPVWFRTYRSAPGDIDFELVLSTDDADQNVWGIGVTLDADPFAVGELVTQPTVTVSNNPAGSSNPCLVVLPEIKGDAPTPLRIKVEPANYQVLAEATSLISCIGSDKASAGMLRPTSILAHVDTTAMTGDPAMVGGNFHRISFATAPGRADRMTCLFGAIPVGTYKALLRVRASAAGSGTFKFELRQATDPVRAKTLASAVADVTDKVMYVDLGDFDWPMGGTIDGDDFLPESCNFSSRFAVERKSGAVGVDVDEVVLMQVRASDGDADTLVIDLGPGDNWPAYVYIDGASESVRQVKASGEPVAPFVVPAARGGFPTVQPGAKNVLRYLQSLSSVYVSDDISQSALLTIAYRPRYLYLAAG